MNYYFFLRWNIGLCEAIVNDSEESQVRSSSYNGE